MLTITNEDNMALMARYPDKHFDLAIIDPPYGIGESGSKNHSRSKLGKAKQYEDYSGNDEKSPEKEFFNELIRVSKNQIIWGANHFISKIPFDSPSWIVWDKENGENDFADCELAYTSFKSAVRKYRFRWHGMLQGDMKNKELRIHPNQKPVALYKWLLDKYAKPNDKILDTHLGSGSLAIACHDYGYDLTACEMHSGYYNKTMKRIKDHTSQVSIFDIAI